MDVLERAGERGDAGFGGTAVARVVAENGRGNDVEIRSGCKESSHLATLMAVPVEIENGRRVGRVSPLTV